MDKAQKQAFVEDLKQVFETAKIVVVTQPVALDATETAELRSKVNEANAKFRMTKNRLVKIAIKGTQYEPLEKFFSGQTAIAYSEDPIAAAKVSVDFANENEKLQIVGGAMGEKELDADSVKQLAKLPSLDELRGKIVGLLQAPAGKIARVVQAPPGQLARVVGAYGNKPQ